MTFHRNTLLSPALAEPAGGTAIAEPAQPAQPSTPAQPSATPVPSSPTPAMRSIPETEFQTLQSFRGKAQSYDGMFGKLRQEYGAEKLDDVYERLGRLKQIESDPNISGIVKALSGQPSPSTGPSQPNGQPLDPANIPQFVEQTVKTQLAKVEAERFQREHESAAHIENDLISQATTDDRFKPFFGDKSFDDNYSGAGSKAGRAVACLLDAEFAAISKPYELDSPRAGSLRPLTDSALAKQARENVLGIIRELQAVTLLQTSGPSMPGLEPRTGSPPQQPSKDEDYAGYPTREKVEQTLRGFATNTA